MRVQVLCDPSSRSRAEVQPDIERFRSNSLFQPHSGFTNEVKESVVLFLGELLQRIDMYVRHDEQMGRGKRVTV